MQNSLSEQPTKIVVNEASASNMSDKQVVSKQRVTDHGEVYTHEREVNAMLDLVKQETERGRHPLS